MFDEGTITAANMATACTILAFCVALPIWITYYLRKNYMILGETSFKKKFEFVYKGIDLDDNKLKVSHFSIFLLKRFILIMIPTILGGRQGIQAFLLLHMSVLYGAYVVIIRPYCRNVRQGLEIFNAFVLYFIALITYTFSDFNTHLDS